MSTLKFILLILLVAACGKNEVQEASDINQIQASIVDGHYDKNRNFDSVVYIEGHGNVCTGTLINPYIVITAVHCVPYGKPKGISLKAKVIPGREGSNHGLIPVLKVFKNPKFNIQGETNEQQSNDIAILILASKAPIFESKISPLLTMRQFKKFDLERGDKVTIAGYGLNENEQLTGHRRFKNVELMKSSFCEDFDYRKVWNVSVGAWRGDSGGPAFYSKKGKRYQIGVLSTGSKEGLKLQLGPFKKSFCQRGHYLNVAPHLPWIETVSGYSPNKSIKKVSRLIEKKFNVTIHLNQKKVTTEKKLIFPKGTTISITPQNFTLNSVKSFYANSSIKIYKCENELEQKCYLLNKSWEKKVPINSKNYVFREIARIDVTEFEKLNSSDTLITSLEIEDKKNKTSKMMAIISLPIDLSQNFTQEDINQKTRLKRTAIVLSNKGDLFEVEIRINIPN